MAELNRIRSTTYEAVMQSIADQESALVALYQPLKEHLVRVLGSENKISFVVRRKIDLQSWSDKGEDLMDLRRSGTFQGAGQLLKVAKRDLQPAWESGSATDVARAVEEFRSLHHKDIVGQSRVDSKDRARFGQWWRDVLLWLYGTEHITVDYSICFDTVPIERLSPGTRGIVLLLLYLAIDQNDHRPLIVDQPEENLDPRSIYREIVQHLRTAKRRRQVIVVTHNANLVVNADADQVIIANVGSHDPGQLPAFSYESGGIENPHIREKICEILEGGREAFLARARRLRMVIK